MIFLDQYEVLKKASISNYLPHNNTKKDHSLRYKNTTMTHKVHKTHTEAKISIKKNGLSNNFCGNLDIFLVYFYFINAKFENLMLIENK